MLTIFHRDNGNNFKTCISCSPYHKVYASELRNFLYTHLKLIIIRKQYTIQSRCRHLINVDLLQLLI
jgi:hypothetical protein